MGEVMKPYSPSIEQILKGIIERGDFLGIERHEKTNYDIEHAMAIVEAIGKMRTPKFKIDDENRFAYENFIKWLHSDPTMQALDPSSGAAISGNLKRGIYIAGNTGSGKSWCLEIMREYARAIGFPIKFQSEEKGRLLLWSIYRADELCREFAECGDIQQFKTKSILAIQDLGQEQQETLYMGNRMNVLKQLLEYRGDQDGQLTLITSNLKLSGKKLEELYGDRVQSRLFEMCNYFEIKGKDRRKNQLTTSL